MAFPHDGNKFERGTSGNPTGRPKGVQNSATRLIRWLELEVDTKNPDTGEMERSTLLEKMDAEIIKKALTGDIAAYREILDRVEGKPLQRNQHELPDEIQGFNITIARQKLADKLQALYEPKEEGVKSR